MKSYLPLIVCVLFFTLEVKAQHPDSTATETILKIQNPYKVGQNKWLIKQGFNTAQYDWQDDAINLSLKKAISKRSDANALNGIGIGLVVSGLVLNGLFSAVHQINEDPDKGEFKPALGPYYIGAGFVASSFIFRKKSKKHLKKAQALQKAKYTR